MSEALRSVMMELGFEVDAAKLDALEARLKTFIGTTKKTTAATDDAAKKTKKTLAERVTALHEAADEERAAYDARKAFAASSAGAEHAAWQKASKGINTFADATERASEYLSEKLGTKLRATNPLLDKLAQKTGMSSSALGKVFVGATLAAVAVMGTATRAAFAFANAFAADAEALRDTARESRVTTTQLQELDHAAVQGGVGVERMRAGVAAFGQALRSGERYGNGTTSMLRRLGIQARDANGRIRPTGELINDTALALERIENPYRRAHVAQQLFGASGRRMLDVLHSGPGGIAALRDELADLGGGITPEATEAAQKYTQAQERLKVASDSLRSVLAVALLPALSWVTQKGAELAGLWARLTRGTHVTQLALVALGLVGAAVASGLVVAWFPVIAPVLATAAAVAAVIAVMDDLITMMEGGDSATGRFIDRMFGVGTTESVVRGVRDLWRETAEAAERAVEAVRSFGESSEDTQARHMEENAARERNAADRARASLAPGEGYEAAGPSKGTGRATRAKGPANVAAVAALVGPALATVPATRTVTAPGSVSQRTSTRVINRTSAPVMHFHGVTDADQIAGRVRDVIRREDATQRDADHPQEDDE